MAFFHVQRRHQSPLRRGRPGPRPRPFRAVPAVAATAAAAVPVLHLRGPHRGPGGTAGRSPARPGSLARGDPPGPGNRILGNRIPGSRIRCRPSRARLPGRIRRHGLRHPRRRSRPRRDPCRAWRPAGPSRSSRPWLRRRGAPWSRPGPHGGYSAAPGPGPDHPRRPSPGRPGPGRPGSGPPGSVRPQPGSGPHRGRWCCRPHRGRRQHRRSRPGGRHPGRNPGPPRRGPTRSRSPAGSRVPPRPGCCARGGRRHSAPRAGRHGSRPSGPAQRNPGSRNRKILGYSRVLAGWVRQSWASIWTDRRASRYPVGRAIRPRLGIRHICIATVCLCGPVLPGGTGSAGQAP